MLKLERCSWVFSCVDALRKTTAGRQVWAAETEERVQSKEGAREARSTRRFAEAQMTAVQARGRRRLGVAG